MNGEKVEYLEETVSEYSFYQSLIFKENAEGNVEIVHLKNSGHLVRTKLKDTKKGGVAINASFIDTLVI